MADDNLLAAGASGFFQGLSSTVVPLLRDRYNQERELRNTQLLRKQAREDRMVIPPPNLAGQLGFEEGQPVDPESIRAAATLAKPTLTKKNEMLVPQSDYIKLYRSGKLDPDVNYKVFNDIEKPTEEDKVKSKLDAKLKGEFPKARGAANNTVQEFDNMINEAKSIQNDPSLSESTGLIGGRAKITSGQRRVSARLETLKAKTLLNVLESLKELSKSGASGFGQLSNIEGENIRNSISTLDPTISTKDFSSSLDRFISNMENKKSNVERTFLDTYGKPIRENKSNAIGTPSLKTQESGGSADDILREFKLIK